MESINIEDTNLVNLTEASRRLGIGYATLWRWTKKGKVTPVRILGLPYLTIEQIESLKNEKNNKRLRGTSGLEEDSNILKVNEAMEINLVKLNSSHVTELVRRLNSMSSQDKFFSRRINSTRILLITSWIVIIITTFSTGHMEKCSVTAC